MTSPSYDRWTLRDENEINYGYCAKTGGNTTVVVDNTGTGTDNNSTKTTNDTFYITTAINYTNGPGHMGHAYEATTSDVIARYQRCIGAAGTTTTSGTGTRGVYFVTGSDEHGQKIAEAAEKEHVSPIEICNKYVTGFQVLNQRLLISNDDYIRTTSTKHELTAKELWIKCANAGDIYLDTYIGWYNVREETFVTETDAILHNYVDPVSGLPYKRVEEESYFFKMSKYQSQLIDYIENVNPTFIQPVSHKNLILQRLKSDELRDLSISRTTFDWGIPVPEGFHSNHVMYVWMDALSNYLTGVNGLGIVSDGNTTDIHTNLTHFWPANVHIIGKDILWFHTVIWPCLLFSAGVAIPQCVFAHGFVNDKDGKKMSKSMGNVVDPHDMLDKFTVDTFRWYLCKEAPYGGELSFSEDNMRDMHNADLCGTLGNLIHRATTLCTKYCNGMVPDVPAPTTTTTPIADLDTMIETYMNKMNTYEIQGGANIVIQGFRDVNGYLQDQAPWHIVDNIEAQQIIVRATLEAVYALSHLLIPFLPEGCIKIFNKLGTEPKSLSTINRDCRNLVVGTKITVGDILYERSISDAEKDAAATSAVSKKESHAEAQARKKEAKAKQIAASKAKQAADAAAAAGGGDDNDDDTDQCDFSKMDIRVGKIVKVWYHEGADKLFCEQIDVGDAEGPREIASGLRLHYTLEEMQDRLVLVVCNLKPAKIVGFTSNGMVLAAKAIDGTKVELIDVPIDTPIGERVHIEGIEMKEPYTSTQIKKKKVWETVSSKLKTQTDDSVATWDGHVIRTSKGACKAATLLDAPIA